MTLWDHVDQACRFLRRAGIAADEARLDAEWLARHLLGLDRAGWLARTREPAPAGFGEAYERATARRARREPVAYIIGLREFWGLEFEVTPAVLIPRPETELIVEEALATFAGQPAPSLIIDVATGSGCLAVVLARAFPAACVVATDRSRAALDVASRNAHRAGAGDRIRFVQADLVSGLRARADLVVSNPPYVPSRMIATLPPEVRDYEPHLALDGGAEGLDVLRALAAEVPSRLGPSGVFIAEFGVDHEPAVRRLFGAAGWSALRVRPDLQGIPRIVTARREAAPEQRA